MILRLSSGVSSRAWAVRGSGRRGEGREDADSGGECVAGEVAVARAPWPQVRFPYTRQLGDSGPHGARSRSNTCRRNTGTCQQAAAAVSAMGMVSGGQRVDTGAKGQRPRAARQARKEVAALSFTTKTVLHIHIEVKGRERIEKGEGRQLLYKSRENGRERRKER